ncbi:hypothetical protein DIPPA_33294, partial [Diplonema papillatum]
MRAATVFRAWMVLSTTLSAASESVTLSVGSPFSIGADVLDIAVTPDGNTLVVCGDDGLTLVNVSDASQPRLLSSLSLRDPTAVAVQNANIAFVATDGRVAVVDVSDAGSPRVLLRYTFNDWEASDISVAQSPGGAALLLVTSSSYDWRRDFPRLVVIDVTNVWKPVSLKQLAHSGSACDTVTHAFFKGDLVAAVACSDRARFLRVPLAPSSGSVVSATVEGRFNDLVFSNGSLYAARK